MVTEIMKPKQMWCGGMNKAIPYLFAWMGNGFIWQVDNRDSLFMKVSTRAW